MKFKINGTEWTIREVDGATINDVMDSKYMLGATLYTTQEILLLKEQANIIKTLKHELMHVWLSEYGHNQHNKEFEYEDVCEIVASSNDFVNEIVNEYLGIQPLYLCDKEKNIECRKRNCDVCTMTDNVKYAKRIKE